MRSIGAVVTLRDVVPDDLPIFFEHQMEPNEVRMAAFPPRERDAFMAHWAKILSDDALLKKTIVADGEIAGNIGSFVIEGRRLIGYWLGSAYWGRGIATQALAQFLRGIEERP